jgi:Toxic anion resistance protein (TelA)
MSATPSESASEPTSAPLQPPAAQEALTLEAPKPVDVVGTTAASSMVPLDQATLPGLDKMVSDYVGSIVSLDQHSPEFAQKAESIRTMGDDDIRASSAVSNRMLEAPMRQMSKGNFSEGGQVAESLVQLRHQIEDLDPS